MKRHVAAVLVLALAAGAAARPDDEEDSPRGAGRPPALAANLEATWSAKGPEAFAALAREFRTDPFTVVGALVRRIQERGGPPTAADVDLLAAYARALDGDPSGPGVAALVGSWASAEPAEFEREERLRDVLERVRRFGNTQHEAEAVDLADTARADLESRVSIAGPVLRAQLGRALLALGRLDRAEENARSLADEARRRRWPSMEASALRHLAVVALRRERFGEAAAGLDEAARIDGLRGAAKLHAATLKDAAYVHLMLSRIDAARTAAETGRAIASARGWRRIELGCRSVLAFCTALEHRPDAALAQADAIVNDARGQGLADAVLEAEALRVAMHAEAGRLARALSAGEDALRRAGSGGSVACRSRLHSEVGVVCSRLGLLDDAARHLREALSLDDVEGGGPSRALVLERLAAVESARGADAEALRCLEASRAICERVGDPRRAAGSAARLADHHAARGAAKDAMRWAGTALAEAIASRSAFSVVGARLARGAALVASARPDEALEEYATALAGATSPEVGSARIAGECRCRIGALLASLGRHAQAVVHLRAAVQALADMSDALGERDAMGLAGFGRTLTALGTRSAHVVLAGGGDSDEAMRTAWWFEEVCRARLLAGSIVNAEILRRERLHAELRDAEGRALAAVDRARAALSAAAEQSPPDPGTAAAARQALSDAQSALDRTAARADRDARRSSDLVRPEVVALDAFRARLDAETVCLTYSVGGTEAFLLAVARDRCEFVSLGDARSLRETAGAMLDLASTPDGAEERVAERLGDRLLQGVEPLLAKARRLIVVPDAELAYLPFDALVLRRGEGRERVVERFEVSYAPSATVFCLLETEAAARPPGRGVVALGDPVVSGESAAAPDVVASRHDGTGGLPRLTCSGDEVRAVAALYPPAERTVLLREDATLRRFLAAVAPAALPLRAVHVACHAFVDPGHPRLSGLVFSGGELLDVETLYRTRLPADLAVLSACETARGGMQQGEGVIGLTRGFFLAGVPRVVVSAWRVSDVSATRLMTAFHARLVRGEAAAAALRGAKLEMLRRADGTSHPYHWAPFVLWGLR